MPDKMDFEKWRAADIADRKATAKRVEKANRIQRQTNAAQRRVAASNNRQAQAIEAQNQIQAAQLALQHQQAADEAAHRARLASEEAAHREQQAMEAARYRQQQHELDVAQAERERRAQFAMWVQSSDGQRYLEWEAQAKPHVDKLRALRKEFADRVSAEHSALNDYWLYAHNSAKERIGKPKNLEPAEPTLSEMLEAAIFAVFLGLVVLLVGGIAWFISRLFTSADWSMFFIITAAATVAAGILAGICRSARRRYETSVAEAKQKSVSQHRRRIRTDAQLLEHAEQLRPYLQAITMSNLAREEGTGLAEHIYRVRSFDGRFCEATWTKLDISRHISDIEDFIATAPDTFPTSYPPLDFPTIEPSEAAMLMPQTREFIDELARAQTADSDEQEDANGD